MDETLDKNPIATPTPEAPLLLNVSEAAIRLRCKPCTVRELIRTGRLAFVNVGRLLFVRPAAIEEFVARVKEEIASRAVTKVAEEKAPDAHQNA